MCKNTACELLCYVVLQAVINAKAEVTNSFLGHFPWLREWREMALGSTGRFGSWSLLARFRFDPLPLPYTNLSRMRLAKCSQVLYNTFVIYFKYVLVKTWFETSAIARLLKNLT